MKQIKKYSGIKLNEIKNEIELEVCHENNRLNLRLSNLRAISSRHFESENLIYIDLRNNRLNEIPD